MTTLEDRDAVIRLIGGYMVSNAIRAAGELGIFTHLDSAPDSSMDKLAVNVDAPMPRVQRLVSLLQYAGLVEQTDDKLRNTRLGAALVPGRTGSLADFAQNFASPLFQRAWDHLESSVRTGTAGFELEYQQPVYDYLAGDEAANTLFNQAMQEEAGATAEAAISLITLDEGETIVDIGGGDGTFLTTLLQNNPTANGIVFDTPAGIAAADQVISRAGLADRCTSVGGDFFSTIPAGGTTYIVKSVLQDWDDAHALELLRRCQEQIPATARLIIIGNFLPDAFDDEAAVGYLTDVCMLVISGGRERTIADLRDLLDEAGFDSTALRHDRVGPLTAAELKPS